MAEIEIKKLKEDKDIMYYKVFISDDFGKKSFNVSMDKGFYKDLNTKTDDTEVIRKSFEFLLKRESKESILSKFNIEEIINYFPEFREESLEF